jgi:hypothetical protein
LISSNDWKRVKHVHLQSDTMKLRGIACTSGNFCGLFFPHRKGVRHG